MARLILELDYHAGQLEVAQSDARFRVLAAGRRWGKTRLGVTMCVRAALDGARQIGFTVVSISVSLVAVATTAAVAVVARWLLPGMGWAEAIALGAIVSPPDAVSATAIGKRLNIPRRVATILEGESLVNDATALVLYRAAVGAAIGGSVAFGPMLAQHVELRRRQRLSPLVFGFRFGLVAHWSSVPPSFAPRSDSTGVYGPSNCLVHQALVRRCVSASANRYP